MRPLDDQGIIPEDPVIDDFGTPDLAETSRSG